MPIEHIAHLRKQFKCSKLWLYFKVDFEKKHTPFWIELNTIPHLLHLESPSFKIVLCQVWSKLAKLFWTRIYIILGNVFWLFRNYFTLEKGMALFWKNLNTLHQKMFCAKFGWNWPCGSWAEDENGKSLQTDGRTDGRQLIKKSTLSIQLCWA